MPAVKTGWAFISSCVYICMAGSACVFVCICVLHVYVIPCENIYVMGICICSASVKLNYE